MSNPLANAASLRAAWTSVLSWHRVDRETLLATVTDDQMGAALDAAFTDVQERFERLQEELLGQATRSLIQELYTLCGECRLLIPKAEASQVNPFHKADCSLHPNNVVG
jgi:thioesterase domain-containing protein